MSYEVFQRGGRQQFPTTEVKLVRVSKTGIFILNKAASSFLNSESVLLLFDREKSRVAIRPCDPETSYAVTVQQKRSATRISTHAFVKWIGNPICKVYRAEANKETAQLEFTVEYEVKP